MRLANTGSAINKKDIFQLGISKIPLVVVLAALSLFSSESVCVSRQPPPPPPPAPAAAAARIRCRASTVEHLDRLDSSAERCLVDSYSGVVLLLTRYLPYYYKTTAIHS